MVTKIYVKFVGKLTILLLIAGIGLIIHINLKIFLKEVISPGSRTRVLPDHLLSHSNMYVVIFYVMIERHVSGYDREG